MHTIYHILYHWQLPKNNNQHILNGFPFETYVRCILSMIWPNPILCNIYSQFDIIYRISFAFVEQYYRQWKFRGFLIRTTIRIIRMYSLMFELKMWKCKVWKKLYRLVLNSKSMLQLIGDYYACVVSQMRALDFPKASKQRIHHHRIEWFDLDAAHVNKSKWKTNHHKL